MPCDRLAFEPVAAVVAAGGNQAEQAEVGQVTRAHQLLRAHHALKRRQPDPRAGLSMRRIAPAWTARLVPTLGPLRADRTGSAYGDATRRRFERQRVSRVRSDLAGTQSRDDLVLANRPEGRVRAQRHQRGQRQQLELRWQVRCQQVLGPAQALPGRVGDVAAARRRQNSR